MASDQFGYLGRQRQQSGATDHSVLEFVVSQMLAKLQTSTLVRVVACTNDGGLSPVGFVDIEPLVLQVDGSGNAVAHAVIYNVPYFRLQGGANAVIIDPQAGDIGLANFASRDLSKVKVNRTPSLPGNTGRVFDYADALYVGGLLNGAPTQYLRFSGGGIEMFSPTQITLSAPVIIHNASTSFTVNSPQSKFSGAVIVQGLLSWLAGMTGSITSGVASVITGATQFLGTVTANGKRIDDTHTHGGVQSGTSNTNSVN